MERLRVLVADDILTVRNYIKYGLVQCFTDIDVDGVSNGKEAIQKLENERYDFIISDWEMPELNGCQLLEWVRSNATPKSLPFLMVTTKNDASSIHSAIQKGVNGYLIKPFTIDAMLKKVTAFVDYKDRRSSERFYVKGHVVLNFRGLESHGELLDISMGGLLCVLDRNESLPGILENITLNAKIENKFDLAGIGGFAIRIESAEHTIDSQKIKVAVKFTGNIDEDKKRKKSEVIAFLQESAKDKLDWG